MGRAAVKRLDRPTLEIELALRLRNAMKAHAVGLRAKNPAERDKALERVVDDMIDLVDNAGTCVVRADLVGFNASARPGIFGQDEPWPGGRST